MVTASISTHAQVGGAMFTATLCVISLPNGATGQGGCCEQPPSSGKVSSVSIAARAG